MTFDLFAALFVFAAIMAFTPGPNNTILMASGIAHGFKRSLPVVAGVAMGFPFLALCVGLGLGKLFEALPILLSVLKIGGVIYMLWLAYKIATAEPSQNDSETSTKPLNFMQAFGFQWINPKAWIMAIYALTNLTLPGHYWVGLACVVGTFLFTGITSASTWAGFGAGLKKWLTHPRWYRPINYALAASLLASLVPMLWH
ncbi:MAG: LysE family translocator [Aestuariivirga sp.]